MESQQVGTEGPQGQGAVGQAAADGERARGMPVRAGHHGLLHPQLPATGAALLQHNGTANHREVGRKSPLAGISGQ